MAIVAQLVCFGLRQVMGESAEDVVGFVVQRWTDHTMALPKALREANDRSWKALGIALAGDSMFDQLKVFFAAGEDVGIRQMVTHFLNSGGLSFTETPVEFRKTCLAELKQARKSGLLSTDGMQPKDVGERAKAYQRFGDPEKLIDGAHEAVAAVAEGLATDCPKLSQLLKHRVPNGPPLLAAAFAYFFRREVETNDELANGLMFDGLKHLSAAQAKDFEEVHAALHGLGNRFDKAIELAIGVLIEELERLRREVKKVGEGVEKVGEGVEKVGEGVEDVRAKLELLTAEIRALASRNNVQPGEAKPQLHVTINNEREMRQARALVDGLRKLPAHYQPADLHSLLGDVLRAGGDYREAKVSYQQAATTTGDNAEKASNFYKSYLSDLEQKHWDQALEAVVKAADLDGRFTPFPLQDYEPKRILGAGGFGTAFLCLHRHIKRDVVVKSLHAADLERNMDDVFAEAETLDRLRHPSIIGVRHCSYADAAKTRPYIVMDYFPGGSMQDRLDDLGSEVGLPLEDFLPIAVQIAQAMSAAHSQKVWHRDLKPDNVLVRKDGDQWQVRIIDFGLAVRARAVQTSTTRPSSERTIYGTSAAGTAKYAPPEQMGELPGVAPGPYSDVYAFGKLCMYTLFKTTEPKDRHWKTIPAEVREPLKELLEQCTEDSLNHRHKSFEPVLRCLEGLGKPKEDPEVIRRKEAEEREAREHEQRERERLERERLDRERREREENERLEREERERREREEKARLRREGEVHLRRLARAAFDQSKGADLHPKALMEIFTEGEKYLLESHRFNELVAEVRKQWLEEHPAKKIEIETNSLDMLFALIPAGTFLMGSPKNEELREGYDGADETQHKVSLTKDYFLGVHPVTRGQFAAFVKAANYRTEAETRGGTYAWNGREWKMDTKRNWRDPGVEQDDDHPVVCVSWNDAKAFCEWLSTLRNEEGRRYRLPTEAEWEYACRAGTTTPFFFGETISTDQANYDGAHVYGRGAKGASRGRTTAVNRFKANAWGLCDMHGNVFEWCHDWFGAYPKGDLLDPQGRPQGQFRAMRGGSWTVPPRRCRSAFRYRIEQAGRSNDLGFRVCFTQ